MPDVPLILSIDDDESNQVLLQKAFENANLHVAYAGEQGVGLAGLIKPDVILLDIAMPGMNGIEVCRILKNNPLTSHIPVLFVSAMNTLEDRLAGYKVGAEDYICKPINIYELKCKIDILMAYQGSLQQLDTRLRSASDVAYTALSNAGELGVIVNFVETALACPDFPDLADQMLDALSQYQVSACLVIRSDELHPLYFSGTVLSPLETQLLDMARDGKRIVTVGRRCIFNADNISVLVKDMPADEDRAGRLRDHIARLMSVAEARIKSLVNETSASQFRAAAVSEALADAGDSLQKVDDRMRHFQSQVAQVISDLTTGLEEKFMGLMLSDEQEEGLLQPVRTARSQLDEIFDESIAIDSHMDALREKIMSALGR